MDISFRMQHCVDYILLVLNHHLGANLFSNHTSSLNDYPLSRNPFVMALWFQRLRKAGSSVTGRGTPSRAWKWALSKPWKWTVQGDTCVFKARDFIGKECLGRKQQDKGTQENFSAMWLTVSGFIAVGLISRWSSANHCDLGSLLVANPSLSWDGFQCE